MLLLVAGMVGIVGMVGGLVSRRWQGSLETWVEGGNWLEGGSLQVRVDVHTVGKLLLLLLLSTCWLILEVAIAAAAAAWVQRVVDVVVVGALCLPIEPLLDAAVESEGTQVADHDHEDGQQDGDQDGCVVQLAHLVSLEVGVNQGIVVGAWHTLHRCDCLVAEVA